MRSNDNFNIITGAVMTAYPSNAAANRRFSSLDALKTQKATEIAAISSKLPELLTRRLGKSRDHRQFNYCYNGKDYNPDVYATLQNKDTSTISKLGLKTSMVNATKTAFNLINHSISQSNQMDQHIGSLGKQCPVSKFTELGRSYAPNYTDSYMQNPAEFHKKAELCTSICKVQKSYGTQRFFRKFK